MHGRIVTARFAAWIEKSSLFTPADRGAFAVLRAAWLRIGGRIAAARADRPSVAVPATGFRRARMRQMLTRPPRVFDAQMVGILRQGTAFLASAAMIALAASAWLPGAVARWRWRRWSPPRCRGGANLPRSRAPSRCGARPTRASDRAPGGGARDRCAVQAR